MKPDDLLRRDTTKLSSGCPILHGGIPLNSITESGTGKTQLSLQLLLSTSPTPSLYLHSEFPLPFPTPLFLPPNPPPLHPLHSVDHLLDLLPRLDSLLPKFNIKLIVIDSIAALFRGEFDNTPQQLRRRSTIFFKVSSKLRFYASKFGLAVVMTNQVVDVMDSSDQLRIGNAAELWSSGRRVCAALGLLTRGCLCGEKWRG